MLCVQPIDLDGITPNTVYAAHRVRGLATRRLAGHLRQVLTPSILAPVLLLVFGCYALLTLTGIGPRSWQAALCSDGALDISSCRGTPVDPARVSSVIVRAGTR